MRAGLFAVSAAVIVANVVAFFNAPAMQVRHRTVGCMSMVATEVQTISTVDAPDFYWQYRLERLADKKSSSLPYSASNYPEAGNAKDLYDSYYLDLTLQGKMDGFDWVAEKSINDEEWMSIYNSICGWTESTVRSKKPSTDSLPASDFDLLKQFYPQLNFRDLETPFSVDEVGEKFPYLNMKEMMTAAITGQLNVPGYSAGSISSIEATEARKELAALKDSTMKKVDKIYENVMEYAKSPFPDAEAKTHYQALKKRLADFPQTPAAWATFRQSMEKEVDEMARLASKKEEHHGHHHEEEEHGHEKKMSPAEEFEAKYGRNLDVMQERMAKFKADPEGFLESSIMEKYGKTGLDIWKKSQEFSAQMSVMSEADKAASEASFTNFLAQA